MPLFPQQPAVTIKTPRGTVTVNPQPTKVLLVAPVTDQRDPRADARPDIHVEPQYTPTEDSVYQTFEPRLRVEGVDSDGQPTSFTLRYAQIEDFEPQNQISQIPQLNMLEREKSVLAYMRDLISRNPMLARQLETPEGRAALRQQVKAELQRLRKVLPSFATPNAITEENPPHA